MSRYVYVCYSLFDGRLYVVSVFAGNMADVMDTLSKSDLIFPLLKGQDDLTWFWGEGVPAQIVIQGVYDGKV